MVSAYQDLGFTPSDTPPPGTPVSSGTVSGAGALTVAGLTEGVSYWLVGQDAQGRWRWMRAYVARDLEPPVDDFAVLEDHEGRLDAEEAASATLDTRLDVEEAATVAHDGRLGAVESGRPIVLTDFDGVDRTGVGFSDEPFAAALLAANGGTLFAPFGSLRFQEEHVAPPLGVTLLADDVEFNFGDMPNAPGTAFLTGAGSAGTPVAIDDAEPGDTSITGAAGIEAGLAPGDKIKLYSADVFDPGRTASTEGEQLIVASTASGVINVFGQVMGTYSTSPFFFKVTQSKLNVQGTAHFVGGGVGSLHRGVVGKFIDRMRIGGGVQFTDVEDIAVQLWDCLDFAVDYDAYRSNYSGRGYGVSLVNTCQWGKVRGNREHCRHGTSTNNSPDDGGGIPRHNVFERVIDRYSIGDAHDAHAAAEHNVWDRCEAHYPANSGFNIEAPSAVLLDPKVIAAGDRGINLFNCAAKAADYVVKRADIQGAVDYGARFQPLAGGGSLAPVRLEIDGDFRDCLDGAVRVDPTDGGYRIEGPRITGRSYNCSTVGSAAAFTLIDADDYVFDVQALDHPDAGVGWTLTNCRGGRPKGLLKRKTARALHLGIDRDEGFSGIAAPSTRLGRPAATAVANGTGRFMLVEPSRDMLIVAISFVVTIAAGNNDDVDVGIFDKDGNRIVSSGATAGKLNVEGRQEVAITPTWLKAGTPYYAGFSAEVTGTAPTVEGWSMDNAHAAKLFGDTPPDLIQASVAAMQPLPASVTVTSSNAVATGILLGLLEV